MKTIKREMLLNGKQLDEYENTLDMDEATLDNFMSTVKVFC